MAKSPEAAKKPEGTQPTQQKAEPQVPSSSKKAPAQLPGACACWGCKAEAKLFNFCSQHYDHFKFGLIKKTGEPVADYEKKYEHFVAYQKRLDTGRKAA